MFRKLTLTLLLLCSVAYLCSAIQNDFNGYKIYDINAKNEFEKGILLRLSANEEYDFFDLPRLMGKPARVMIKPKDQSEFETLLKRFNLAYTIINEDFGRSLELERIQNDKIRSLVAVKTGRVIFNSFLRFAEINDYLDGLAAKYPLRVLVKNVGKSYEKRDIKTITITNGDGIANKKVIFVDAGIHAREWIAPAQAIYIIYQLVENFLENAHLLNDYDWIVLPVVNPDGYEYTHTTNRMWRMTRKPVTKSCIGTDGNRNFDFHWGESGAAMVPCVETYRGVKPFSEPETKVVRDILHSITGRGKMYLTLHSYGKYLLYPWGYTSSLPDNVKDLDEVAQAGADAIKNATGTVYSVGSSTNVLYEASGGSDDYALGMANIPISITMELPEGGTGFDPSTSQIQPFVTETWVGIRAMAEKVIEKY